MKKILSISLFLVVFFQLQHTYGTPTQTLNIKTKKQLTGYKESNYIIPRYSFVAKLWIIFAFIILQQGRHIKILKVK